VALMPSSFIIKELQLKRSPQSPLKWLNKKGDIVIEIQQFTGPIRSEIVDAYFRHPKMLRLIISEMRSIQMNSENFI
jgi:hypothetical protein